MHSVTKDPWAVSTQKPVPGTTIHHHNFLTPTSQHGGLRKTGIVSRDAQADPQCRCTISKPPAERHGLPRLLSKASGILRDLHFSFSFQQHCCWQHPQIAHPSFFVTLPLLRWRSLNRISHPWIYPPETLCSILGECLNMEETRTQLLLFPSREAVFI